VFTGMNKLDFIWLDYNQFSGTLPDLGSEITNRQEFSISHNRFTSEVVQAAVINLADFTGIKPRILLVDVSYNQMTGRISPFIALVTTTRRRFI
jgi:hypothetical protein